MADNENAILRFIDARRTWIRKYEELMVLQRKLEAAKQAVARAQAKEVRLLGQAVVLQRGQEHAVAEKDQAKADKIGVERCVIEMEYRAAVVEMMEAQLRKRGAHLAHHKLQTIERLMFENAEAAWMGLLGIDEPLVGPCGDVEAFDPDRIVKQASAAIDAALAAKEKGE